jgi:hypothetical protein
MGRGAGQQSNGQPRAGLRISEGKLARLQRRAARKKCRRCQNTGKRIGPSFCQCPIGRLLRLREFEEIGFSRRYEGCGYYLSQAGLLKFKRAGDGTMYSFITDEGRRQARSGQLRLSSEASAEQQSRALEYLRAAERYDGLPPYIWLFKWCAEESPYYAR